MSETQLHLSFAQFFYVLRSLLLISVAAAQTQVFQLALTPVYGSIPTAEYHLNLAFTAFLLTWYFRPVFAKYLPERPHRFLAPWASCVPFIQSWLFSQSSRLGATWGPPLTEICTSLPLVFLSIVSTSALLESANILQSESSMIDYPVGIGAYSLFALVLFQTEDLLGKYIGSSLLLTRYGLQLLLACISAILSPSRYIALATLPLFQLYRYPIHIPNHQGNLVLNHTLQNHFQYQILARHESVTGYISVLESIKDHFRVLRCDHSLLGGEWLEPPRDHKGTTNVPEPVFAIFVMMEAVRLVTTQTPMPVEDTEGDVLISQKVDSESSALLIGLGIGTSATAFLKHNISTTIVEIDPIIHKYAQQFFSLPPNHTAEIRDALSFVEEALDLPTRYDYIIHDVFTGGAEPASLFTLEFIASLNTLLQPAGVIAINYAGDISQPAAHLIVRTIKAVFPSCRIFREDAPPVSPGPDLTNMVIFCVKPNIDFTFREPIERDFLESHARRHYLLPKYEIPDDVWERDGGVLRKGNLEPLTSYAVKGARAHWSIMRQILPPKIWELW
ncbi:MAG: hypothetical protein M1829_003336 [Trizodia sp. TS-e1964]|nr:MAG: hypothetical protein M1829_003336 [Trizodia sp. TS-e1964]